MTKWKAWATAVLFVTCLAMIGLIANSYAARASGATARATAQDPASLDRRISTLEQRLYFIETRINRLEQQATVPVRPPATDQSRVENELMRAEIETVKGRINEIACGLMKLDERTLPAGVRESRARDSNVYRDPCRQDAQTPLRLSARP